MKILVIAAHPDDEVLGCGGALSKLKKGNQIYLAYLADGVLGRLQGKIDPEKISVKELSEIKIRRKGAAEVAKFLKAEIINDGDKDFFPFIDQRLDGYHLKEITDWLSDHIRKIKPEVIFTHFAGDLNLDHRMIAEATLVAARPKESFIKKIYAYEVSESTMQGENVTGKHFNPNVFEKIDLAVKKKLFIRYQTEIGRTSDWEKSIETVARYRGFQGGYDFAEAFMLIRERRD